MKVQVLLENTSLNEDLKAEHGLSLYIETDKRKILFDMGQTGAFADNAEEMGIDLSLEFLIPILGNMFFLLFLLHAVSC